MNRRIGPEPSWDPYAKQIEEQMGQAGQNPSDLHDWSDEREANNLAARDQRGLQAAREILALSQGGNLTGSTPLQAPEPPLPIDPSRRSLRGPAPEIPESHRPSHHQQPFGRHL